MQENIEQNIANQKVINDTNWNAFFQKQAKIEKQEEIRKRKEIQKEKKDKLKKRLLATFICAVTISTTVFGVDVVSDMNRVSEQYPIEYEKFLENTGLSKGPESFISFYNMIKKQEEQSINKGRSK